MNFNLAAVEALAPDQASLAAASKIAKPAKWLTLQHQGDLWWGECQGSGSNPYRTVVDTKVVGYKCTCPSRKFPCKHSLALMWIVALSPGDFLERPIPQWVNDWLGRRRTTSTDQEPKNSKPRNILAASQAEASREDDPRAEVLRVAAAKKRQEANQAMMREALKDVELWISDQLTAGLMAFLGDTRDRCRQIAARLVDKKASGLASRVDEMPARLLAIPNEERPDAVIREFGKIILLAKAWQADPYNPQAARDVGSSERRDDVIGNPETPKIPGLWEVIGEKIYTRRDGLVSHAAWFLRLDSDDTPRFALLQDYYPASAGKHESSYVLGSQFSATMAYYPSAAPLRAVPLQMTPAQGGYPWPVWSETDPLSQVKGFSDLVPWQLDFPVILSEGRIGHDARQSWWCGNSGETIPLGIGESQSLMPQIMGMDLNQAVGIWDGMRLTLLSAMTSWGRVQF